MEVVVVVAAVEDEYLSDFVWWRHRCTDLA